MHLGILIPPVDSRPAGLGVYVDQVVSRLVQRNRHCSVFSADGGSKPGWAGGLPFIAPHAGPFNRAVKGALPPALNRLLLVNRWLPGELRKHEIEILFIPFQLALMSSPVPQVVVMHDLRALRLPATSSFLARAFLQQYVRPALRRADRIIAVSESTKQDLRNLWQLSEDAIDVVYEGFDRATFHPYGDERLAATRNRHGITDQYAIYVGTFARHKNLRVALETLAIVRMKFPEFEFVVAGRRDAGDFAAFIDRVKHLKLQGCVRVLGYVANDELGPLIAGARAFLFPSLYEGFGLSALEAMACGTPVLASNVASLPEVVGSGGYLLDPQDPHLWAETLTELIADETNFEEIRARALRQAARFHWDKTVDSLQKIIGEVLESKRKETEP